VVLTEPSNTSERDNLPRQLTTTICSGLQRFQRVCRFHAPFSFPFSVSIPKL
jgi:hypothetical protein